jgi:hypothetical protein
MISQCLWVVVDGKGLASRSLLSFSAGQMLSSSTATLFGDSRLPLESIGEKGGAGVASVHGAWASSTRSLRSRRRTRGRVSEPNPKISLFAPSTNRASLGRSVSWVCSASPRTGQRSRQPGTEDWLPKGGRELSPERNLPDRP